MRDYRLGLNNPNLDAVLSNPNQARVVIILALMAASMIATLVIADDQNQPPPVPAIEYEITNRDD
jgi:hypothetical protein